MLLPPRADSDGTLRRIYEEALILFAERGYHAVSMREIAQACGIKASSIYAHLPSKEQLLRDLVVMAHDEHRDQLREALLGAGSDPADQLRGLVGAHVRFHATYALLATVGNNEMRAPTLVTRSGCRAARRTATYPPIDPPTTIARSIPR